MRQGLMLTGCLLFSISVFAESINFNAMIEESSQDRASIEKNVKGKLAVPVVDRNEARGVVKFEREDSEVVNVQGQVEFEYNQKQAKKATQKNMKVEIQSLEEEIAGLPEE